MSKSYVINATPKVLERVYYAIERCQSRSDASAQAINKEIEAKFGAPLSTQIWTTINAARRDNALTRIKTKAFDFSKHGRIARTGKGKKHTTEKTKPERRNNKSRRAGDNLQRVKLDTRKHPRYVVSIWRNRKNEYHVYKTRKQADRFVRKMIGEGLALSDVAIYQAENLAIRLATAK